MDLIQRTLVVLKPDTIGRSITGEIISRFERAWLHIVAMKMLRPDKDFLYHHYENIGKMISRRWEKAFNETIKMMTLWPVIAMIFEWVEAVEHVRKLVGVTEPKAAAPGTIRWDYANMSFQYADNKKIGIPNLVHASWSIDEATEEIKHRFSNKEIFDYDPIHSIFTR